MKLLVIGCKLQGTEAVYLATEAGFQVTAVDRNPQACGAALAERFVCCDVRDEETMLSLFAEHDVVLPAIEDEATCRMILSYGKRTNTPVLFDAEAYAISSSKHRSNGLFEQLRLPLPEPYPECGFPVIVKPDNQSGSAKVSYAADAEELEHCLSRCADVEHPVIQQYLEGRSFSLEVLRIGGEVIYPMITEVQMDDRYDCKRIVAPAELTEAEAAQMLQIGTQLDSALQSNGIFDIEVISHKGTLKLLEIDARLPSQTPIAIYHACGLNMVQWMAEQLVFGKTTTAITKHRVCWYQQIQVTPDAVRVYGEHIMADCVGLHRIHNFFGADEAMTDYTPGCTDFCAILILCGETQAETQAKQERVLQEISAVFVKQHAAKPA